MTNVAGQFFQRHMLSITLDALAGLAPVGGLRQAPLNRARSHPHQQGHESGFLVRYQADVVRACGHRQRDGGGAEQRQGLTGRGQPRFGQVLFGQFASVVADVGVSLWKEKQAYRHDLHKSYQWRITSTCTCTVLNGCTDSKLTTTDSFRENANELEAKTICYVTSACVQCVTGKLFCSPLFAKWKGRDNAVSGQKNRDARASRPIDGICGVLWIGA